MKERRMQNSLLCAVIALGFIVMPASYAAKLADLSLSPPAPADPGLRIIALSPQSVEMLYAIGAGESIVATTDHVDFPIEAKAIMSIGGYYGISIEKVIALNPDLIVSWESGNQDGDIQRLKALGFTMINSDPKTLDEVAVDLERLGEATGHGPKARALAAQYRQELAQIKALNSVKPKVKLFYQLWSEPLMTVAQHSWVQQSISACHGDNVFFDAASDYPQVSIENVLLTGAQVIIQSQDAGNVQGLDWSQWPELPAVKQGHIYQLDADLLHRASPRSLLGVTALCEALDKAR